MLNALRQELEELKIENAKLHATMNNLEERNGDLEKTNIEIEKKNSELEKRNTELDAIVDALKKRLFGQRSERFQNDPDQLLLIEELSAEAREQIEQDLLDGSQSEEKEPKRKKKRGRKPLPKDLEKKEVVLDLTETEKICPHGQIWTLFGEERTQELEIRPALFFIIEYVRPKYKNDCLCPECRGVKMASLPARPIEKGRPGPGLLAHVAVSKYGDHLPLYRQSQMYARQGLDLPRSTLCSWILVMGSLLRPIVEAMKRRLFEEHVLQADETPIELLGEKKKGKTHRAYLWAYGVPWGEVVFDFSLRRTQDNPEMFLKGFRGALQIDGYDGYNSVFVDGKVKRLGCFAHVRRKFHEALKESPEEAKTVLASLQLLYRLERDLKKAGKTPEERVQARQEHAKPVLEDLEKLLAAYKPHVLPGGNLGDAIRYTQNEWDYLIKYLEIGEAEIDNNSIEQTIRPVAIGRKNFLFIGSPNGGHSAATLYSLITSCKRIGVNPWEYLRDVIDRVSTHAASKVDELTPRGWQKVRERQRRESKPTAAATD